MILHELTLNELTARLAAGPGTMLTLHAEGGDADQAISELEQLVTRNFEEE